MPSWSVKIGLIVAAFVVARLAINHVGYCGKTRTFLTKERAFDAAIREVIRLDSDLVLDPPNDDRDFYMSKTMIIPQTVEEFRKEFPDCCVLGATREALKGREGAGIGIGFWQRMFGTASKIVSVHYSIFYDHEGERFEVRRALPIGLNACGDDVTNRLRT